MISAKRIGKAFHGFQRYTYDQQTTNGTSDTRGRHLFDKEYGNRCEQQAAVYERVSHDTEKLKRAPQHNDRKYTQQMVGVQLAEDTARYTAQALIERLPV